MNTSDSLYTVRFLVNLVYLLKKKVFCVKKINFSFHWGQTNCYKITQYIRSLCKNRRVINFWGLKYNIPEAEKISYITVLSVNWRLYCTTLFNEEVIRFFSRKKEIFPSMSLVTQIVTRCCRYNEHTTIKSKNYI